MDSVSYQVWFIVRYVHLTSVVLLAGGAFTLCALCIRSGDPLEVPVVAIAAPVYEWMFWSIAGVTVATGVSNLGLKGEGLLGPQTFWGTALSVKIVVVLALLAISLVRSDLAIRCRTVFDPRTSARIRTILGALYGLTFTVLLGALWIGLGLAHGRY